MILKVFGSDNAIHLIENVTDVVIHMGRYAFDPSKPVPINWGPYTKYIVVGEYIFPMNLDPSCDQVGGDPEYMVRVIDFTKDGDRRRAIINAFAYVCTDEGKTIEKVVAER